LALSSAQTWRTLVFRDPQINYYVRDVTASVDFYTELLGFKETFRTPTTGAPQHVELRLGGLLLGLASHASALNTHGLTTGGGGPRAEVCVWTDDVDATYAALVERGVPSLSAPHAFLDVRLRAA
jgi:lactoylglutathione lyase